MYGEPGFRGEPINLNVVNADIRDILSYITDQYGINFVIDKSVSRVPVTVKVNDVPWNIALDSVLQSQELGVQVNGNILRVADIKTLASEGELYRETVQNSQLDNSPLYTEFIRLNYATGHPVTLTGAATIEPELTTGTDVRSRQWRLDRRRPVGGGGGADRECCRSSRRGFRVAVDRGRWPQQYALIITDVEQNIDCDQTARRVS